jgi:hypothetical protein
MGYFIKLGRELLPVPFLTIFNCRPEQFFLLDLVNAVLNTTRIPVINQPRRTQTERIPKGEFLTAESKDASI